MRRAWVASLFLFGGCLSETDLHVAPPDQPADQQAAPPQVLRARVLDLLTKDALAGAEIRGVESDFAAITGADGAFTIAAPFPARIAIVRDGYHAEEMRVPAVVDLEDEATFFLFPAREPTEAELTELGMHGTGSDGPNEGEMLIVPPGTPDGLTFAADFTLPRRIRVGRTFTTGGSTCPAVRAVEEMSIEEYVKGVVTSEIGVFRWTSGGDAVAEDAYKTLAVAARSYVLYFYLVNPNGNYTATINGRTVRYHINDTACHQRYADARHGPIDRAVDATAGEVLVNTNRRSIDKYEYAASCGRGGTRPEHRTALVSDRPGVTACVGQWCGHNTCAGHEGCVVRGVCQWGTLERSKRGDTYAQILAHYQPELVRTTLTGEAPPPPPTEPTTPAIVVDNATAGRFRASSTWSTSSYASGKIGADYRYRRAESTSDPAEYKVNITEAGSYEVFARVPGDGYNTDVPYIVHHRGGRTVVRRNISTRGSEWVSLGTYAFDAKDDWIVQISCWTTGGGWIIADAVRFVRR